MVLDQFKSPHYTKSEVFSYRNAKYVVNNSDIQKI